MRSLTAQADRRVTYGTSMGGYAAVRFADALGADAALALSPQYSNDPTVVPWEDRWAEDGRRIAWLPALAGPIRCRCVPVLICDTQGPDLRYARLIAADTPSTILRAPYASHPVSTFLSEIGLLREIVLDMVADNHDPAKTARRIRSRRHRSSIYLATLAERQPPSRPATAIAIARRAAEMGSGSVLGMLSLARLLTGAGHHEEALRLHAEIAKTSDRAPGYLVPYADALVAAGDVAAAIIIADEVVSALPDRATLRNWLAWMHAQKRDYRRAVSVQQTALAIDPGSAHYAVMLARYRKMNKLRFIRPAIDWFVQGRAIVASVRKALIH